MKQIDVYTTSGRKQGKVTIPQTLNISTKPELIHQAYLYEVSQKKAATFHTKDRGEVSGSGKKPWRQKGTGRARAGSIRSPLWRGGGVTFGPTAKINFKKRIPAKQRQKAIRAVLSSEIREKKLILISNLSQKAIKTKDLETKIAQLPIEGTVLVVLEKQDPIIQKSAKNIPYLKVTTVENITLIDLLNFDFIVATKKAFEILSR